MLVDKLSNKNFEEFIILFKLKSQFKIEYYAKRAKAAFEAAEYSAAAKIALNNKIFGEFDMLDLC